MNEKEIRQHLDALEIHVGNYVKLYSPENKLMVEASRENFRAAICAPIPMLLWCPECGARHIDLGEFAVRSHHTHACQECGVVWRPAIVATVGVQFLPGFKNE
jgi:rubredoxin